MEFFVKTHDGAVSCEHSDVYNFFILAARELHGHIPQIGRYVQAGYPGDYESPSTFSMGGPSMPEYSVMPRLAKQQQLRATYG